MADKKEEKDFSSTAYILGILSIVFAITTSLAGIVLGIIGVVHSKKQKTALSDKGRKLSLIGIIIGIVVFSILLILTSYLQNSGIGNLSFPTP